MTTSNNGIEFIKGHESCRLKAYRCPAGVLTIGWGHTGGVKEGMVITQAQADSMLADDLKVYEAAVNREKLSINQNQFDALVSFCYNVGPGNFRNSKLLKEVRINPLSGKIPGYFASWIRGGGKVLPGLVRRRREESELYFS